MEEGGERKVLCLVRKSERKTLMEGKRDILTRKRRRKGSVRKGSIEGPLIETGGLIIVNLFSTSRFSNY